MKNEFNVELDRNGYAPSIVQPGRVSLLGEVSTPNTCYCCGRREGRGFMERLERMEPWGAQNRTKSKSLGVWVILCRECREDANVNQELAVELRRSAQHKAMAHYGWSMKEWVELFGKSELLEEEAAGDFVPDAKGTQYKIVGQSAGGFRVVAVSAAPH